MSGLPEFGLGYLGTELRGVLVEAVLDAAHERFFERTIEPDTLIDAVRVRVLERL